MEDIATVLKTATILIKTQRELIELLETQVMDLSMMSKIELGDDVITEIKRLNKIIDETKK